MDAEILTDLTFDDLRVGDSVLTWAYPNPLSKYQPEVEVGYYVLTSIVDNQSYHQSLFGELRKFSTRDMDLRYRVSRVRETPARVPCVKCGRLLHHALSAAVGVTHGC